MSLLYIHLRDTSSARAGRTPGQRAAYCGAQHAYMSILVMAQSEKDYNLWRMHQFEAAVLTQQQKYGREQFPAHAAGRRGLAANSLKPGSEMPDTTRFSGHELQDLVAYRQSLQ